MTKIRMTPDVVEEFGGETVMRKRVEDFIRAKEQHRFTVDVPAPVEHGLIEAVAARGGWDAAVEIIVSPPPEPEPEVPTPPAPLSWQDNLRGMSLADAVAFAESMIDGQAERIRSKWLTRGSGQAMEYMRTEQEARAWAPGQLLSQYPMLLAEALAMEDATGKTPEPGAVVASILANAEAWATIGAAIKRERRARKLRLSSAVSSDDVLSVVLSPWAGLE